MNRRNFLHQSGLVTVGFLGLRSFITGQAQARPTGQPTTVGYGPLVPDPEGILDLPQGFSYQVISRTGETMSDGFRVPGAHDGMAAFPGPRGKTILVRNHELTNGYATGAFGMRNELLFQADRSRVYDGGKGVRPATGGTTTLIYDTRTKSLEGHFLSLAGTVRNCAGGLTPWNSWITCEETIQRADVYYEKDHGYNFEVPATAQMGLTTPIPLKAMGRFNHEAVACDPRTGIVYQTEDRGDGLLYRYIPNHHRRLHEGGKLQALVVRDRPSLDTRNWENITVPMGQTLLVDWVDINNVESPEDDLRKQGVTNGAAVFARGEGALYGNRAFYFVCTDGGPKRIGQVWRYLPSLAEGTPAENRQPGQLELYIESTDPSVLEMPDNITISPQGDLVLTEDGGGSDFLVGVSTSGQLYHLARNAMNESELAGVTFSPDGSTLFANIQTPGLTLAITGPWGKLRS